MHYSGTFGRRAFLAGVAAGAIGYRPNDLRAAGWCSDYRTPHGGRDEFVAPLRDRVFMISSKLQRTAKSPCACSPAARSGRNREIVQQVQEGLIDFMASGSAIWGSVAPRLQVLDFPFLWRDPGPHPSRARWATWR